VKKIARRAAVVLLLVVLGLAGWAFWWEPRRLVVRRTSVALPCWRGAPITVAIASDLHIGAPGVGVEKLDRVVREINAARPDVVVLLGDFVIQGVAGGRFVPPETIAHHLSRLRAPGGVYAVLGNHDWWLDASRVRRAFQSVGIHVVDDTAVRLRKESDAFWLVGISDFTEGPHDVSGALQRVSDSAPAIAITHNPDVFPSIPPRVCLTLAGHTHGGQVALPLIGRPVVPSQYGARYAIGPIHEHGRQLFVTSGVGTSILPVRFRVPPEVVLLRVGGRG
jgi:uncharacterized protein